MIKSNVQLMEEYIAKLKLLGEENIFDFKEYKDDKIEIIRYSGNRKKVIIPDFVYAIGDGVFQYGDIEEIDVRNVEIIDKWAFKDCKTLHTVKSNGRLRIIGSEAFHTCIKLRKININSVSVIRDRAFMSNYELELDYLPESIKELGVYCFTGCDEITSLNVQCNVRELPKGFMYDSPNIRELTLGKNITGVGEKAFVGAKNLNTINIEGKLENIGKYAFTKCEKLKDLKNLIVK